MKNLVCLIAGGVDFGAGFRHRGCACLDVYSLHFHSLLKNLRIGYPPYSECPARNNAIRMEHTPFGQEVNNYFDLLWFFRRIVILPVRRRCMKETKLGERFFESTRGRIVSLL